MFFLWRSIQENWNWNILKWNVCLSLFGVTDGQGLHFRDYSISSIAPCKSNQAQLKLSNIFIFLYSLLLGVYETKISKVNVSYVVGVASILLCSWTTWTGQHGPVYLRRTTVPQPRGILLIGLGPPCPTSRWSSRDLPNLSSRISGRTSILNRLLKFYINYPNASYPEFPEFLTQLAIEDFSSIFIPLTVWGLTGLGNSSPQGPDWCHTFPHFAPPSKHSWFKLIAL
jgi:hypothetical protein